MVCQVSYSFGQDLANSFKNVASRVTLDVSILCLTSAACLWRLLMSFLMAFVTKSEDKPPKRPSLAVR